MFSTCLYDPDSPDEHSSHLMNVIKFIDSRSHIAQRYQIFLELLPFQKLKDYRQYLVNKIFGSIMRRCLFLLLVRDASMIM